MGFLHNAWLHAVHLIAAVGHVLHVHLMPNWMEQYVLPLVVTVLVLGFVVEHANSCISSLAKACQRIADIFGAISWYLRALRVWLYLVKRRVQSYFR